jgi:hypothetical protein
MFKNLFRREASPSTPLVTTSVTLQNDLWVIHPPADRDAEPSASLGDDTMLSGVADFVTDANVILWNVRVALVMEYSCRVPDTNRWKQTIIYEQGQTFEPQVDAVQVFASEGGKHITRRIEFGILLPRNLATYDHLPHAKIIPQVRVTVEFSKNTWSSAALAKLPRSPPVYVDGEEGKLIAGRRFNSESWRGGSVLIGREGRFPARNINGSS